MDAGRLEHGAAAHVVFVERVAAVDDRIAHTQQFGKREDRLFRGRTRWQHDPDTAWRAEFLDDVFE